MLDLSGTWTLTEAEGGSPVEMVLPGDGHSALLRAGRIPDPYFGRNEYDCRWVAERDWVASRSFDVDPKAAKAWVLEVTELDTVAEIRLNGRLVLKAANQFRRYRVDVTRALKLGENRIEILFRSSIKAAEAAQKKQPYFVPYSDGNCPIPNGNMLRKVQCDFGWDWNIALAPIGVHGTITLKPVTDTQIASVIVGQKHAKASKSVDLSLKVNVNARRAGDVPLRIEIGGEVIEKTVSLPKGDTTLTETITLKNPALWWPAGLGDQPLYTLTVSVGHDTHKTRIGIRTLDLVAKPDRIGTGFKFTVNGHDTFARGVNWIPADALPGRITPEKTRALLQSAVDANMNMIRVWGGGRYEPDWFYDLCDELGLMVWQDFMFACNLYPATPDFLNEVGVEVREQVARLQHHACVALWCGDNELIGALNWYPESRENRDRYLVAYDRLNRTIETALKETDPSANWWPSSPSPGPMSFGDAWHDDTSGDMHFWSVWHEGKDFEHYRDVSPRFCSEFGFQSYPSLNVIKSFADKDDLNIASPVMESHQKNTGGNARIAETMFRYFRFPSDFGNFVWLSQVQQALAIRTAVEYWRSLKPHCMGTLYWQLNDTWPVASWSSLDYGGNWKLLHHFARHFYAPVTITVAPDATGTLTAKAVNDTTKPVTIEAEFYAVRMDGTYKSLGKVKRKLGTEAATELKTIPGDRLAGDEILAWAFTASDGSEGGDHFSPVRYKSLPLQDPKLTLKTRIEGKSVIATVTTKALALFVTLEAETAGRFSDNCFTMTPGHKAEITFTPDKGSARQAEKGLRLRDLYSSSR